MVNQDAVDNLLKNVLFDQYSKSTQFVTDRATLLELALSSDEQIDEYLQTALSQGVSTDAASTCIELFLKLKISENAS